MSDDSPTFGRTAAAYDRGGPGYPEAAVQWLLGGEPRIVLELGAGTGKLTQAMVDQGHAVHATEPDSEMLAVLEHRVPGCSARQASAEEIPANDRSVDVVVVGQAFHRFDHERALPEIARILKPGGHLAIIHNERDTRIPWVRRLGDLIGNQEQDFTPEALISSPLFGFVEDHSFKHWQDVNRESIVDLAVSRSNFTALDDAERDARVARVLAFYDDFGRGMDGMQIPYVTRCFKASVLDPQARTTTSEAATDSPETDSPDADTAASCESGPDSQQDGPDTEMLLIDFR